MLSFDHSHMKFRCLFLFDKTKPHKKQTRKKRIDERQTIDGPSLLVSLYHCVLLQQPFHLPHPPFVAQKKNNQYQCHHFVGSCICLSSTCNLIWQPQYFTFAITYSNTFHAIIKIHARMCIFRFSPHKSALKIIYKKIFFFHIFMARGEAEHRKKIMMEFFQSFSSFGRRAFFHFVCVFEWFFPSLNANFHNVFCFIYLFLKSIATDAAFFLMSHTRNVYAVESTRTGEITFRPGTKR